MLPVFQRPKVPLCVFWRGLITGRQIGASREKADTAVRKLGSKMPSSLGFGKKLKLLPFPSFLPSREARSHRLERGAGTLKLNSGFETLPCFSQLQNHFGHWLKALVSFPHRNDQRQSLSTPDAQDMAHCHCRYNRRRRLRGNCSSSRGLACSKETKSAAAVVK